MRDAGESGGGRQAACDAAWSVKRLPSSGAPSHAVRGGEEGDFGRSRPSGSVREWLASSGGLRLGRWWMTRESELQHCAQVHYQWVNGFRLLTSTVTPGTAHPEGEVSAPLTLTPRDSSKVRIDSNAFSPAPVVPTEPLPRTRLACGTQPAAATSATILSDPPDGTAMMNLPSASDTSVE